MLSVIYISSCVVSCVLFQVVCLSTNCVLLIALSAHLFDRSLLYLCLPHVFPHLDSHLSITSTYTECACTCAGRRTISVPLCSYCSLLHFLNPHLHLPPVRLHILPLSLYLPPALVNQPSLAPVSYRFTYSMLCYSRSLFTSQSFSSILLFTRTICVSLCSLYLHS